MLETKNAKPLPTTFVGKATVNDRVKNYHESKLKVLSEKLGRPDTTSGWYSLREFEELVKEMYYLHADGLRVYFGAYPDDDLLYPGQLTIIFVPTFYNAETDSHEDIAIDDTANFSDRAARTESNKMRGTTEEEKSIDTLALCPPFCTKQTFIYPF
jgi:hypothetical protein